MAAHMEKPDHAELVWWFLSWLLHPLRMDQDDWARWRRTVGRRAADWWQGTSTEVALIVVYTAGLVLVGAGFLLGFAVGTVNP
jgi:hypothetical protein